MTDLILSLKARARILHRDIQRGDRKSIDMARNHKDFRRMDAVEIPDKVRRRHCFSILAQELGFRGWPHLLEVIKGEGPLDYGTFFYPRRCRVHWNIWFASYEEAAKVREEHGGYLLGYKKQFMVVDEDYIRSIGFQPGNEGTQVNDRDWIKPKSQMTRDAIYGRLIELSLGVFSG